MPRSFSLALICVSILLPAAGAQSADALFRDGVEAYRRGDDAAAAEALKAALAQNPGHEAAYRMWESVEQRILTEMLLERGELGALAERFLGLSQLGRREIAEDPGGAEAVVARLLEGGETERQTAMLELRATYGSWAVPALVRPLGSSDIDERVLAIQALRRLGSHATLPLIAVLDSDDPTTRRNAAAVLGALRDPRAAAALAAVAASDDDPVTRDVASDALAKLGPSTTDPTALAGDLALGYFAGRSDLVRPYDAQSVVWEWRDGELVGRRVLGGLFPFELAASYAVDALEAGGGEQLRGLLAAVHAGMKAEILAARQLDELSGNEDLEAASERLPALERNLALAGAQRGLGLLYCLQPGVRRVAAAETLMAAMSSSPAELQALTTALEDEHPAVGFAAASALARLGRVDGRVVRRLADALDAVPQRLVVSLGDTGITGGTPGWHVLSSDSPAEGLLRAKSFPPKDVIVLQDGLGGVTLDTLVFGLKNDPRTADVPLIVVTPDVDEVERLYGDQVAAVLSRATFADVEAAAGERDPMQQAALERARLAAARLATLPPQLVREAAPRIDAAIRAVAEERTLVALLEMAGRAEVVEALGAVEARLVDGSQPDAVRVAAMEAAARLWGASGGRSASSDLSDALFAALDSGEPEIVTAAAAALGQLSGVTGRDIAGAVR